MIRTVLGDIAPDELGVTYMHEHLIIDSEIVARDFEHIHLPSVEDAKSELLICKNVGVSAMVDCMPTGSGRDIKKLAEISKGSGVHLIAATGLHTSKYYRSSDELEIASIEKLSDIFISEIVDGCEGTSYKAGIIKVATSGEAPTDRELRLFEAAAITQEVTGAPILTHCEHGKGALQQIDIFLKLGINLENVVMSHTDKEPDSSYHNEILSTGINVEYDQSLRQIEMEEPASALLTVEMFESGYGGQIMLGTDGARRSLWTTLGGAPGLAALYLQWSNKLKSVGVSDDNLQAMFVTNPAKFLSFKGGK